MIGLLRSSVVARSVLSFLKGNLVFLHPLKVFDLARGFKEGQALIIGPRNSIAQHRNLSCKVLNLFLIPKS